MWSVTCPRPIAPTGFIVTVDRFQQPVSGRLTAGSDYLAAPGTTESISGPAGDDLIVKTQRLIPTFLLVKIVD